MHNIRINRLLVLLENALEIELHAAHSERFHGDKTPVTKAVGLIEELRSELAQRREAKGDGLPVAVRRIKRGLVTVTEMAREVGVKADRLTYLMGLDYVDKPTHKNLVTSTGGIRLHYSVDDIAKIKKQVADAPVNDVMAQHEERRQSGYFSRSDALEMLDVSNFNFDYHVNRGLFFKPSAKVKHCSGLYYTKAEVDELARRLAYRRAHPLLRGNTKECRAERKRQKALEKSTNYGAFPIDDENKI
jgi:hypothetical protein